MPVQNWLQAQAVRGFVTFLSLHWPRLLQMKSLWIPSSAEKAGAPTGTDTSRAMEQLSSTWHLPSANLECRGRKVLSVVGMSLPVFGLLGDNRFNLLWQCFSPGGNLPKHPAFFTFSSVLVCFSVSTMGSFYVFYMHVCVCVFIPNNPHCLAWIHQTKLVCCFGSQVKCMYDLFFKPKYWLCQVLGKPLYMHSVTLFALQNNPLRWVLLSTPFHRWGNWYLEMTCPEGTLLVRGSVAPEPRLWSRPFPHTSASDRTWFSCQICPYSCDLESDISSQSPSESVKWWQRYLFLIIIIRKELEYMIYLSQFHLRELL